MHITRIETALLRVPLNAPFTTALRSVDTLQEVVVLVHTDTGHVGYGAAPPTAPITGETIGSVLDAVRLHIAPCLTSRAVGELNQNLARVHSALLHNNSAKAAVEIALYDLWAQLHKAPLYRMLGGGTPHLVSDMTISTNQVQTMVGDALAAVERGFSVLKIKLGRESDLDIERVRAIHAAVNGRARLRLDANQGWTPHQAVHIMQTLERAGVQIELLEQPVHADNLEGMAHVAAHITTPVMADESAFGPRETLRVLTRRAAGIINIKLMKSAGLSGAIQITDIARLHGASCMIGCMLESAINVTAAAHLAVARSHIITKIDLDGPMLAKFNPVQGGAIFDGPDIRLSDVPGLGIIGVEGLEEVG